ncbi:hypothetical protein [Serratia marcescens]|jgi:hypothetical protein|uniref:hypothetical protein n=1 Tax=Serratia marcescens TaxID=615 RepID=UPI0027E4B8A3|nr:hypothetical protein [Serratia marcescens]HEJ7172336.1 hypothetical protein [Serratia marcescens]HEJ7175605.1 hypothetical protein [Serratia marcescens]
MRQNDESFVKTPPECGIWRGGFGKQKIADASTSFSLFKQMWLSTVSNMCDMSFSD